jgi:ABC-type uncharacterized transport system substrate-binding protein
MMARSKCSNQRPDTVMQDRINQVDKTSCTARPDHTDRSTLASYGPDPNDEFARSAAYVDRILKGEKPTDLPVQAPNKYELVINLRTAKALGLELPATLIARADEAIE